MPKTVKGEAAKPTKDVRNLTFVPEYVTKGAVRFVEATATGNKKTQSKSVWRNLYARLFDAEGGLQEYLDDNGDCTIQRLSVTIEIE